VKTATVAIELGRTISSVQARATNFALHKTPEYLASPDACRLRRGDNVGAAFRFKPGNVSHNKGIRRPGYAPGRMKETQFKKGQTPPNKRELGELRINADGYIDMKVSEAKGALAWRALHIEIWEDANGPLPPGHALVFKDRDCLNVELENLELITRSELMRRNTIHNLPPAIKGAITALGALKRRIRREEQDRGSAEPSLRNDRSPERQGAADGHRAREGRRKRGSGDSRLRARRKRVHQTHG
jgi:hypothetical protein